MLLCTAASNSKNTGLCLGVVENEMRRAGLEQVLRNKGSSHLLDSIVKFGLYCEGLCLSGEKEKEKQRREIRERKGTLVCLIIHSSCYPTSPSSFSAKLLK